MNELTIFSYNSNDVRTVMKDGEPWFVAKDTCDILELGNASQALSRLDEDEKDTIILNEGIGNPEKSIVSESGLYSLILGSRKPEAKQFKRWITHEVIPSIRKTGTYSATPLDTSLLSPQMQLFNQMYQALAVNEIELKRVSTIALEAKESIVHVENKLNKSIEILTEKVEKDWRETINSKINEMCARCGFNYQTFRATLYEELEHICNCNLGTRQKRMRERMEKAGATYKERNSITKIHVIEADVKIKQIFESIVSKYVLKYAE